MSVKLSTIPKRGALLQHQGHNMSVYNAHMLNSYKYCIAQHKPKSHAYRLI